MLPDQAAGLRRRAALLTLFSPRAASAIELARALERLGARCLVVDLLGRQLADSAMRPLFHWRRQIASRRLHSLALHGCDVLLATDAVAGDAAIQDAADDYAWVIFDAGLPGETATARLAMTRQITVIDGADVRDAAAAYALYKALHRAGLTPLLLGDGAAVVLARAVETFLRVVPLCCAQMPALAVRIRQDNESLSGRPHA